MERKIQNLTITTFPLRIWTTCCSTKEKQYQSSLSSSHKHLVPMIDVQHLSLLSIVQPQHRRSNNSSWRGALQSFWWLQRSRATARSSSSGWHLQFQTLREDRRDMCNSVHLNCASNLDAHKINQNEFGMLTSLSVLLARRSWLDQFPAVFVS